MLPDGCHREGRVEVDLVLAGIRPLSIFSSREKHRVSRLLRDCRTQTGCRHVGHVFVRRGAPRPETFVAVTYPGKWLINYGLRSYFAIDPVVNHADITTRPIILHDLTVENQAVRDMLADARRFGIGRSFVSFSIVPGSEYAGSMMFAFDIEPEDFPAFFEKEKRRLQRIAQRVHFDILAARGLQAPLGRALDLTPAEKRCLAALANGSTFAEIAALFDLSQAAVEGLMDDILAKLDCGNAMHAVSRGLSLGLLDDHLDATRPGAVREPMPVAEPTRH